MIFVVDNGEGGEDHSIYFVESDLWIEEFKKLLPRDFELVMVADGPTMVKPELVCTADRVIQQDNDHGGYCYALWLYKESARNLALCLPDEDDRARSLSEARWTQAQKDRWIAMRTCSRPIREELVKRGGVGVEAPTCGKCGYHRCRCTIGFRGTPGHIAQGFDGYYVDPEAVRMAGLGRLTWAELQSTRAQGQVAVGQVAVSGRIRIFAITPVAVLAGNSIRFDQDELGAGGPPITGIALASAGAGELCLLEVELNGLTIAQVQRALGYSASATQIGEAEETRQQITAAQARGETIWATRDLPRPWLPRTEARDRDIGERCFVCGARDNLESYSTADQERRMCPRCWRVRIGDVPPVPTMPAPTVRIEARVETVRERLEPDSWKCPLCKAVVSGARRADHWRGCSELPTK